MPSSVDFFFGLGDVSDDSDESDESDGTGRTRSARRFVKHLSDRRGTRDRASPLPRSTFDPLPFSRRTVRRDIIRAPFSFDDRRSHPSSPNASDALSSLCIRERVSEAPRTDAEPVEWREAPLGGRSLSFRVSVPLGVRREGMGLWV